MVLILDYFSPFTALQGAISTEAAFTQPVTTVCHVRPVGCLITVPEITAPRGSLRVPGTRWSSNKASDRERGFEASVLCQYHIRTNE